jgi:hypothetical protein
VPRRADGARVSRGPTTRAAPVCAVRR